MKSFSQGNTAFRYLKVPTQDGGRVKRATGTADEVTADKMGDMIDVLAERHAWTVLARITGEQSDLTVADLYGHWLATPGRPNPRTHRMMEPSDDERLEYIADAISQVLLDPLVPEFHAALLGGHNRDKAVAPRTAGNYVRAVRKLIPVGSKLTSANLTPSFLSAWVRRKSDLDTGTLRLEGAGINQFTAWLKEIGTLTYDPMTDVKLPAAGKKLCHSIDMHEAIALADAQTGEYRLFSALLAATGIETSVLRKVRRRDVDVDAKTIYAPGKKTHTRERMARVAEWGWSYALEAIEGKLPDALLFSIKLTAAASSHDAAVASLVARGYSNFAFCKGIAKHYTQRDQRHTWAVYAVRGGWRTQGVSDQLGHSNGILVQTTYGKYEPKREEIEQWEAQAALAATARAKAIGVEPRRGLKKIG